MEDYSHFDLMKEKLPIWMPMQIEDWNRKCEINIVLYHQRKDWEI
jgi:hypothetical protein